ncbi:MAG: LacI family DNA-binding transcriptional regulator [Clostridia bacterium]|nr:LacI family DNA-binding transcriptional regulator [Clostridia bacterium]
MNLTKLSAMANVSVSTVSKAFSDSPEISEATKQRIFSIAKSCGCFEKYYKPQYDRKLIAVICPEMLGIHYTQMATYIEKEITARGATMMLSVSNFSPVIQRELLNYYTHFAHADGIIVIEPFEEIHNNTDVPIVQIGKEHESRNVDCVSVDIHTAMEDAMRWLARMGHTNIGFIGETYAQNEYIHFKEVVEKKKLPIENRNMIISDKRFYDAGYFGMGEMLASPHRPTAIFAAYSHIATGMLQRLKEEGLRVPADISVICMDDIVSAPYADIKLACIKMHLDELCAVAIDFLERKLSSSYYKNRQSISISRTFEKGASVSDRNHLS